MDVFEYLPQLIVAYDGNDEFANLIHVKKADKDKDYYCPCCGGSVKPRALDSTKEQSHYYHITGKCTKESQLHFFCKNWLFEKGSKFFINDRLFEVNDIEIERTWNTKFGDYKPDVTVYATSGETIYFEMFFSNRKTGDDYFCKWNELGNDVVEVDIKEYMFKTDSDIIPSFTYLYHDGVCYSKTYQKKDLYANTIARIKRDLTRQKVLNYKARIEQLDWFWQNIRNNEPRESILESLSVMDYEDLLSCYEIIKRKQCVSYLKADVLNMINQKVISVIRESLDLTHDENIYFDLKHIHGRTYEAGIRLNIQTDHIIYDDIYGSFDDRIDSIYGFPKIVFSRNMFSAQEINIPEKEINNLKNKFEKAKKYKESLIRFDKKLSDFEGDNYKIRMKNNFYTVLAKTDDGNFEKIIDGYYLECLSIKELANKIESQINEINCNNFLHDISSNDAYISMIHEVQNYNNLDCRIDIKYDQQNYCISYVLYLGNKGIYHEKLQPTIDNFINAIKQSKIIIQKKSEEYSRFIQIVEKINQCKNNFWEASLQFDYDDLSIIINQKLFTVNKMYLSTYEKIRFNVYEETYSNRKIKSRIKKAMHQVFKNMERCGYRVMEVQNEE